MSGHGQSSSPASRPFYELPTSIKSCTKIIQETRLQLLTTGVRSGTAWGEPHQTQAPFGLGSTTSTSILRSKSSIGDVLSSSLGSTISMSTSSNNPTGIRPVHTQRPFTPRESDNLWGISARKRPPSAITLSRLSLDDIDETRPLSSSRLKYFKDSPQPLRPGSSRKFGSGRSLDESGTRENGGRKSGNRSPDLLPRVYADMDALTLRDNSLTRGRSLDERFTSGSGPSSPPDQNTEDKNKLKDVTSISYDQINNLDVVLEYLECFLQSSEVTPKEDYIGILKRLNEKVGDVKAVERVRSRLLKLIFQLVERNQQDEDILFWSSFILLHVPLFPNKNTLPRTPCPRWLTPVPLQSYMARLDPKSIWSASLSDSIPKYGAEAESLIHRRVNCIQVMPLTDAILENIWKNHKCHIIGTNLTTVFKMVFKASRSKDYRTVIQEDMEYLNLFMDSFSQICPVTQTESMIYGYGTLKFVCGDAAVLLHIIHLNLIPVMTLHFKILNYEAARLTRVPDTVLNGVFQLTSILRSVVGIESSLAAISQSGLLEEICNSLPWTMDDIDVLSNIVRVLSVVSGDDSCCQVLSSADSLSSALIRILQVWHSREDIVVRLTYCLGNLLAKSEDMRIKLYNEHLSFQVIIQLIGFYMESESQSADDILVKSVRILANWSLNGSIGAEFSEEDQLSTILNTLISDPTSGNVSNELLLCAMSTLNNISYYKDQTCLSSTSLQTADYLFHYLEIPNLEVRTEAMKVLGNLTRSVTVRQKCSENVGAVLMSLNEDNTELLCATIGVLMNIIVEENVKKEFSEKQGLEALINLMERNEETGMNLMICQLLWNMVVSMTSIDEKGQEYSLSKSFPQKEVTRLKHLLQTRLKEIQRSDDGLEDGFSQDFISLARSLHEKLRTLKLR